MSSWEEMTMITFQDEELGNGKEETNQREILNGWTCGVKESEREKGKGEGGRA